MQGNRHLTDIHCAVKSDTPMDYITMLLLPTELALMKYQTNDNNEIEILKRYSNTIFYCWGLDVWHCTCIYVLSDEIIISVTYV